MHTGGVILFSKRRVCAALCMAPGLILSACTHITYSEVRDESLSAVCARYEAAETALFKKLLKETAQAGYTLTLPDTPAFDPYALNALVTALYGTPPTRVSDAELQALLLNSVSVRRMAKLQEGQWTYRAVLEVRPLSHLPFEDYDLKVMERYASALKAYAPRTALFTGDDYPFLYPWRPHSSVPLSEEELRDNPGLKRLIEVATPYLGYPYVWGGSAPETSFDCSGFISWILNKAGYAVGRQTSRGLFALCEPVRAAERRPCDLVFFAANGKTVSHVGLYVGEHYLLHCGHPVSFISLNDPYLKSHLIGYGRLPPPP